MDVVKFASAACAALMLIAVPARAETPTQLDALARASASPTEGVALARRQIAAGDLLEALGTLERVLINAPTSNEARLLHAGVMCRLDDRRGAMVELAQLRNRQIPAALWTEANEACSGRRGR
jgi:Flp pilus assembly protein TadD